MDMIQPSLFDGKICRTCGNIFPADSFYIRKETGKPRSDCKNCFNRKYMERYYANHEQMRARATERYYQNHEKNLEYHREQHYRHRDKILAKKAEYRATRREELAAKERERYRQNPEPTRRNARNWELAHLIRVRERARHWRKRNVGHLREYRREWYRKNAARERQRNRIIKAKRRDWVAGATYSPVAWRAMCDWFSNVCLCCGRTDLLEADHVRPLARGGANTIDNLQPLCLSCNRSKGARHIDYRDPDRLAAFLATL